MRPKIIGIGLSRTGTTSLHRILEAVGFKSKHGVLELFSEPNWETANKYDSLIDTPIPLIFEKIDARFPDCKFILTTRDVDLWIRSMKWMFTHGKVIWDWSNMVHEYHKSLYHTRRFNEAILRERWFAYHARVQEYFRERPEDLMKIDIDDGFDISELCQWLGVPEIDIPPPRLNMRRNAKLLSRLKYAVRGKHRPFASTLTLGQPEQDEGVQRWIRRVQNANNEHFIEAMTSRSYSRNDHSVRVGRWRQNLSAEEVERGLANHNKDRKCIWECCLGCPFLERQFHN